VCCIISDLIENSAVCLPMTATHTLVAMCVGKHDWANSGSNYLHHTSDWFQLLNANSQLDISG